MSAHLYAGTIAANYDRYLGPLLFEPYAIDLAAEITKCGAGRVLELACGTGRVTRHLVNAVPYAAITATDINPDMLSYAQSQLDYPQIQWQLADAQQLPFVDESFDVVCCQFGVMFFPDKVQSFREVHRVLQPGGRYFYTVWDHYSSNPRSAVVEEVMTTVFGKDSPDLLKKGPYSYHDTGLISNHVEAAGFRLIRAEVVKKITHFQHTDEVVHGFVDGSPLQTFLKDKPAAQVQMVRDKLAEALEAQAPQLGTSVPTQAIYIEAMKGR